MKKYLALVLAVLMLVAAFAGCGKTEEPKQPTGNDPVNPSTPVDPGKPQDPSTPSTPDTPVDDGPKPVYGGTFRTFFTSCPPTVNPLTTQDTNPWILIDLISGCMYMTCLNDDKSGWEYKPLLAAELPKQVDTEGKVWEYKINEGMKWTNGDPITADDFDFSRGSSDKISIEYDDVDMAIGAKGDSILSLLSKLNNPQVTMEFAQPSLSMLFKDQDGDAEITMLLMPMLIN
jgi:ABC-type transport system substrate-binding protein